MFSGLGSGIQGDSITPPVELHSHGQYQQQIEVTPEQIAFDNQIYSHEQVSQNSKKSIRHTFHKNKRLEAQRKLQETSEKRDRRDKSSKHIDKYSRHKQSHRHDDSQQRAQARYQEAADLDYSQIQFDPELTQMMDKYAQDLIERHIQHKLKQQMSEIEHSVEKGDNSSYTVQKFYEKNKEGLS